MTQRSNTADVCTRFSLLIKALVTDREAVSVISAVSATGIPLVRVHIAGQDRPRVLGQGNQVARALRILLDSVGEVQGVRYALEIDGIAFEPLRGKASRPETVPEPWVTTSALQ